MRTAHAVSVMDALRAEPGLTAPELSARTNVRRASLTNLLTELERHAGAIAAGPVRECRVTKANLLTWVPVTRQ